MPVFHNRQNIANWCSWGFLLRACLVSRPLVESCFLFTEELYIRNLHQNGNVWHNLRKRKMQLVLNRLDVCHAKKIFRQSYKSVFNPTFFTKIFVKMSVSSSFNVRSSDDTIWIIFDPNNPVLRSLDKHCFFYFQVYSGDKERESYIFIFCQ